MKYRTFGNTKVSEIGLGAWQQGGAGKTGGSHRPPAARIRTALRQIEKRFEFADNDHRNFNRDGQGFNVEETFRIAIGSRF